MVRVGDRIKSVDVEDILYFYSLQKGTYLHTTDNRNYVVDYTLDALGELLDPSMFSPDQSQVFNHPQSHHRFDHPLWQQTKNQFAAFR